MKSKLDFYNQKSLYKTSILCFSNHCLYNSQPGIFAPDAEPNIGLWAAVKAAWMCGRWLHVVTAMLNMYLSLLQESDRIPKCLSLQWHYPSILYHVSVPQLWNDNVVSKRPLKYPIKQHYNLLYFVKCPFWLSLTTQNHFPLITLYMYICLHLESSGSKGIDPSSTQDTSHDKNCYYITTARVPYDTATGATMVANLLDPLAMRFR